MGAQAVPAPAGPPTLTIGGRAYPVLLPKIRDPRLHLAATIISLQVIGQVGFHFRVSIAQILIAILTCAVLEVGIAMRKQHVLLWPASAMLTGNGVAFVLRVPGTQHGDWWSTRGWWIFAGTAAVSLLSKHVLTFRGNHIFNPSNIGLVLCFLLLPVTKAEPLDFWWGPTSIWLALALGVILAGGITILSRLSLLRVALSFWATFAIGIAILAASGHQMTARWHLGPIGGLSFWWLLVTSPEILVFLFFMITDPKTAPRGPRARTTYAVSIGIVATLLIAPMRTEYWSKVALLSALVVVCIGQTVLAALPRPLPSLSRRALVLVGAAGLAVYAAALVVVSPSPIATAALPANRANTPLPEIKILHSTGVSTQLDSKTANTIAGDLVTDLDLQAQALQQHNLGLATQAAESTVLASLQRRIAGAATQPVEVPLYRIERLGLELQPGQDQGPPTVVARAQGLIQRVVYRGLPAMAVRRGAQTAFTDTFKLQQVGGRFLLVGSSETNAPATPQSTRPSTELQASAGGLRLHNVAAQVGLDFRQDSFRFGMSNDYQAMMGGGVCWLDYNNDGWVDLFAVNSYSDADTDRWGTHGGLPRTALFENDHGTFRNVSKRAHADLQVQGDGCVAADLNGDGRPDLIVTTTTGIDLLWNNGNGTFTEGAQAAGMVASGWYTGAAVADVNGDGRPDVFIAGYTDPNTPVPNSVAGFPTNFAGVRDLLYLNQGNDSSGHARFREVGVQAGLESAAPRHGLGAQFLDVNGDGRPDLYVANDEDPNQLYVNVPWPGGAKADPEGLGFRFEERATAEGVADPFAGMGVASADDGAGRTSLFVTNSRHEPSAAYRQLQTSGSSSFANARPSFDQALGSEFAGWGASWVDLANTGTPDLVLTAGAIPVTSLRSDAEPVHVLTRAPDRGRLERFGNAHGILGAKGLLLNGRGLAAADVDNDGRMEIAINTIGGKLVLLQPTGRSGHWLDVSLTKFSPGAVVTVVLPNGRHLERTVQAGSSYLSSEDPRVHFGLGPVTSVTALTVRYPWGGETRLDDVAADQIVPIDPPTPRPVPTPAAESDRLAACAPARLHDASIATVWDRTAIAALRDGSTSEPVQARNLFDLSAAMWDAWAAYDTKTTGYFVTEKLHAADAQAARETAISYAAYRLLLWRASFDANLGRTFRLLTDRLRSLCYSPDFTSTAGDSPAALGNRIAAAAIAAGRNDGSLEAQHYVDASYVPQNAPLVLSQPGSTVHDATFWQPLALAQKAAAGLAPIPTEVQSFVDAQWGHVRGFGLPRSGKGLPIDPGPPATDAINDAYKRGAVDVIRATAHGTGPLTAVTSPVGWNALATTISDGSNGARRLQRDVRLYFTLNGALSNAAITAFGAKRTYQSARPISMIRYLAFQGQSSDPKAASYNADGLPLVRGLIELITQASSAPGQRHAALRADVGQVAVLSRGRWVLGSGWTPPASTPASPGWVSESSTFGAAADEVLNALTGRSFARQAASAGQASVENGIDIPADVTAGRALGSKVARLTLSEALRYANGTAR
jgi:Na+-translocating ferredoxin:NAD+ oxidoreductase RnfD subunit